MTLKLCKWLFYSLTLTPLLVWDGLFYQFSTAEAFFIMAVVEAMAVCFLWAAWKDPGIRPRLGSVGKMFMAFVGVMILASLFGVDSLHSFWSQFDRLTGVVFWLHLLGLFIVGRGILRTQQDWQGFFFFSTFIGAVVALLHLLSFTGLDGIWLIHRSSTIGNSTFFAVYLLFQLVFCFLLFVRSSQAYKIFSICVSSILIWALFTSEAQAVILSSVGGMVLFLSILAIRRGHPGSFLRFIGMGTFVILVLSFVILTFRLADPGSSTHEWFVEHSSGSRFVLWDIAWQGIKERPLFGWGPENFAYVFQEHYNPCFGSPACGNQNFYDRAHNKVLDVLVETGIVGVAVYLALFGIAMWVLWRRTWKQEETVVPLIIISGLAVYFIQNLVALDVPLTLLFWALLLLFVDNPVSPNEKTKSTQQPLPLWLALGGSLVMIGIFVVSTVQPIKANLSIAQWFETVDPEEHLAAFDRATNLSWVGLEERRAFMARQSAGGIWIKAIRGETPGPVEESELEMIHERLIESQEVNPQSLVLVLNLALVLHTQSKFFGIAGYDEAVQTLQHAIELNPLNPQPLWELAAVYLEQNRIDEAVALTQAAVDLDPAVLESQIQRLIAVKFSGDQELFVRYANEAYALSPSLEAQIRLIYNADPVDKREQLIFQLY